MASDASQSATSVIFLPVEGSKTSTRFLPAASTHLPPIQRSVGIGKGAGPDLGLGMVSVWVMGLSVEVQEESVARSPENAARVIALRASTSSSLGLLLTRRAALMADSAVQSCLSSGRPRSLSV